ncbi:F-box domain-containing protein [Mycena indigotica]|uniref:F-box domain-containing protein n=1 Tax=Mycena indigotica TaxID=2126181 RepID=A0A8H6T7K9_9AGAR|nr:F-box domain-containing protein [Mycena indigotica]KAF7312533.1 F-box domain-containing protein [Mycena indigotica]
MSIVDVPPEILCLIFEHCIPLESHRVLPSEAPLLLAQISRRWREICFGMPQLWTNVVFSENGSIELFKLWLTRSANYPISLCLHTSRPFRASTFLEAAVAHRSRWREATLSLPYWTYLELGDDAISFPGLRKLELWPNGSTWQDTDTIINVSQAPSLASVSLNQGHGRRYSLPWTQLASLHIYGSATPSSTVDLLRACPGLLHLSHDSPIMDAQLVMEHPNPYKHEVLRSLETKNEWLLPYLTLPALKRLDMRPAGGVVENISTDEFLPAFLARSACQLRYLYLSVNTMGQNAFANILNATMSVEHLRLAFPNPFSQYIAMLESELVLPKLRYLEVEDWMGVGGDHYLGVLNLLIRRVPHLEACKLALYPRRWHIGPYSPRRLSAEATNGFVALADGGLLLRVLTSQRVGREGEPRQVVLVDRFPGWREDLYTVDIESSNCT